MNETHPLSNIAPAMKKETPSQSDEEIILLQDLAPRRSVKGGAGWLIFGQQIDFAEEEVKDDSSPLDDLTSENSSDSGSK